MDMRQRATPDFIAAHDALSPERIYEHVIDILPGSGTRAADIGAGTGRDAAWLAVRGQNVVAVEPVRELREAARKLHRSEGIAWVDDRLPSLKGVQSYRPFDLIILSAVWQH